MIYFVGILDQSLHKSENIANSQGQFFYLI